MLIPIPTKLGGLWATMLVSDNVAGDGMFTAVLPMTNSVSSMAMV
jgi:hypothetical protein